MKMSLSLQDQLTGKMNKLVDNVLDSLPAIAGNAANIMAEEAQHRAPIDTGALKKSTFVSPSEAAQGAAATFGLGGPTVDYAPIQHEYFPKKRVSGEWKYLENAVYAKMSDTMNSIHTMALKAMRGFKPSFQQRFKTGPT